MELLGKGRLPAYVYNKILIGNGENGNEEHKFELNFHSKIGRPLGEKIFAKK